MFYDKQRCLKNSVIDRKDRKISKSERICNIEINVNVVIK